jgi:hypothetical protein
MSYSMTKNCKLVGSHTAEAVYGETICIAFLPCFNILC